MSKTTARAEKAMKSELQEKEAEAMALMINHQGAKTFVRKEATSSIKEAADVLEEQIRRLDVAQVTLTNAEISMAKDAKALISKCKDLAGQVGDAMARIEKVVTKDFETKLSQLERFVSAMQSLDDLKKNGRLDSMLDSFSKR